MPNTRDDSSAISNVPYRDGDAASRPLVPLRISRAVGTNALMFQDMLAFYGVADSRVSGANATALGFGHARILFDEKLADGELRD